MIPRLTDFQVSPNAAQVGIQEIHAGLVSDAARNQMICRDVIGTVESGRCPLLLTGRKEHLDYFEAKLSDCTKHIFVLKGGMGKKQRRTIAAR